MDASDLYLIDVPPPTISGALHLGHIFSYSHMNFIAEFQRRKKKLVFPFCFDSNGLPTEKLASKNNIREQNEIIKFAEKTSIEYKNFFDKLGVNWSEHPYHTFDENAIKLAELSFNDLLEKKLIYKAEREYFYCPATKVSVSQSEIDENGCYERSGVKVETRFGEGWFIDILNNMHLIRQAIDTIQWEPDHYKHRLHRWLDEVKYDWSVSRERNFGIPIPGEKTGIVFDTWFTSSLTPQMAWSAHTRNVSLECPVFDARFQAHDIIRTWALFTIIKSLYHNDQIPWKNIIISGHVLDKDGKKLSKSAGNAANPNYLLDRYGSDGVRYWTAKYKVGTDAKIDEEIMQSTKRLKTKLKNAARFIDLNKDNIGINKEFEDLWAKTKTEIESEFEKFGFFEALNLLNEFFWDKFCSTMIEHSKKEPCTATLKKLLSEIKEFYKIILGNYE